MAGLRGRNVGPDFAVGVAEGPGREEVEDFGVGEDGGLGVEDLIWLLGGAEENCSGSSFGKSK